jgi:hypothetical protein
MEFFFFEVNNWWIRKGIVGADLVDRTPAAGGTFVSDDDAIEGMLLGPASGESDGDAHGGPFRTRSSREADSQSD